MQARRSTKAPRNAERVLSGPLARDEAKPADEKAAVKPREAMPEGMQTDGKCNAVTGHNAMLLTARSRCNSAQREEAFAALMGVAVGSKT